MVINYALWITASCNINTSVLVCVAFMHINVAGCFKMGWSRRDNRKRALKGKKRGENKEWAQESMESWQPDESFTYKVSLNSLMVAPK